MEPALLRVGLDYFVYPGGGQVQSGLVDELLLHPGLVRFSISSTSRLSETGAFSFIVPPSPRSLLRCRPSTASNRWVWSAGAQTITPELGARQAATRLVLANLPAR